MNQTGRMLLHWSPRSPLVRKVMIAAHETGLADQIDCVRTVVGGTAPHLGLMQQNPLGRLPTLVAADGTVIHDSVVICEYFDTLTAGNKLFPPHGAERLTALLRHALGDGMLDTAMLWLGERARPAGLQSQPHIDLWRLKLRTAVDALEHKADALAATRFDIGLLTVGVALSYLDFRFAAEDWRRGHPRLAAWHEGFDRRPSVRATLPVDDS
jgi:glutathione S-transferase